MANITTWIDALRASHDRLTALLRSLDQQAVRAASYDDGWTIADVASHLGSQAEIFGLLVDAGVDGGEAPGQDAFGQIWDRWNALTPDQQIRDSVHANEKFVSRLEALDDEQRREFGVSMFGDRRNLVELCTMRLGEHAVHSWDVAVALDPAASIADDAVVLLVDTLVGTATRASTPEAQGRAVTIATSEPERRFRLTTGPAVSLDTVADDADPDVRLPAEALVRLVYGRLDGDHTPATAGPPEVLDGLRGIFPGF